MSHNDTIIAQATPPGYGGVGILRISGLKARNIAKSILGKLPKPRYADYLLFKDSDGTPLDRGIALWFPKPNSFTGEDVLELHSHGSPIILDLLLKHALTVSDVRIANPGEFSERAFLNNKLDLVQAESILDLINSSSKQAVHSALNSLQGAFSVRINHLLVSLTNLRTHVEASIDFPNEEIEYRLDNEIKSQLDEIINHLDILQIEAQQGSVLREGIRVVIAGRPNSGKSSLFNALTRRESSIVTSIAGTTRDVLCECIHINGTQLNVVDTAGLCDNTSDEIEKIGIERAWNQIEQADHVLFIVDSTITTAVNLAEIWPDFVFRLSKRMPVTVVRNKIDITGEIPGISDVNNYSLIRLSAYTGDGLDILRDHLKQSIGYNSKIEGNFLARRRHIHALEMTAGHLKQSKSYLSTQFIEVFAEELRLAQRKLSEITGEFTSDDLLTEIFSNFCIGK